MRNQFLLLSLALLLAVLLPSCKSEFEKIRTGGDFDRMYEEAFEYYEKEEYQKAQILFEQVLGNLRGKVEQEKVYFYYAYTQYELKKYILAAYYFNNFASTFTSSDFREEAEFMAAYSNYQVSPIFRLDQKYTYEAIDAFQLFVNTYPESERVEECNALIDELRRKLEKKAFAQAKLYFDLTQYQAAHQSFENLLQDFPESDNTELVRYMIVQSSYLLADNSIITKQGERFTQTIEDAELFLKKFNRSQYRREVRDILKQAKQRLKDLNYE